MTVQHVAQSDMEALLDVHTAAFALQTNFTMRLGRRFLRKTYSWFFDGEDRFVLAANRDGRFAGLVIGTFCQTLDDMQRSRRKTMLVALLTRPHLLFRPEVRNPLAARFTRRKHGGEAVYFDRPDYAYIYVIAVHPDFQGHGIAGEMVQALEAEAAKRKLSALFVTVGVENARSRTAFQKAGFELRPGVLPDGNVMFCKTLNISTEG